MKTVQIPYDLFLDLAMYHLRGEDDYEEEIRQGLEQKLDAMLDRKSTRLNSSHKVQSRMPSSA